VGCGTSGICLAKWFLVAADVYKASGSPDAWCMGARGVEKTQALLVTSTEFLCGPRTINLKIFFPKVPSEYGVFLCGKEKL